METKMCFTETIETKIEKILCKNGLYGDDAKNASISVVNGFKQYIPDLEWGRENFYLGSYVHTTLITYKIWYDAKHTTWVLYGKKNGSTCLHRTGKTEKLMIKYANNHHKNIIISAVKGLN